MSDNLPAVQTERQDGVIAEWSPAQIAADFTLESSLPTATAHDRLWLLSIINGEVVPAAEAVGSTFILTDWISHPTKVKIQEDGELVDAVRTLLIPAEGRPIAFVSVSILHSLGQIMSALGNGRLIEPPVKVMLKARTRGGRKSYALIPVPE